VLRQWLAFALRVLLVQEVLVRSVPITLLLDPGQCRLWRLRSSGVDPNLLMSGRSAIAHSAVSNPFSASFPIDNRKPHQYQHDHMHREKELHSASKAATRQAKTRQMATTPGTALRRSMTDSRARRCDSPSRLYEPQASIRVSDLTDSMRNTHIPRDSSPLKRHRSDAPRPSFLPTQRQSVVLMVDEEGHARTEVRPILDIPNNVDTIRKRPDGASPTKSFNVSHATSMIKSSEVSGGLMENVSDARSAFGAGRWGRRRRGNSSHCAAGECYLRRIGADTMTDMSDANLSDDSSSFTEVPCRPPALELSCSDGSVGLLSAGSQPSTASSNFSMSLGQPEVYPFPPTTIQVSSATSGVGLKSFAHDDVQYPLQWYVTFHSVCRDINSYFVSSSCKTKYGMTSSFQQAQIFVCDFCISAMNRRYTSSTTMYDPIQNSDWYAT